MDSLLNVTFVWAIRLLVSPLVTSKALDLTSSTLIDRHLVYFHLLYLRLLCLRIGDFLDRYLAIRDIAFLRSK